MLVADKSRKAKINAIKAFTTTWLKDTRFYCNHCGQNYLEGFKCCENPQVGRNIDHCYGLMKQVKEERANLNNDFASNKTGTMRESLSLPPRLYMDLKAYFKTMDEPFLDSKEEVRAFMREFPQFCTARKI